MIPRKVAIMDELPMTPNGKVDRKLLAADRGARGTADRGVQGAADRETRRAEGVADSKAASDAQAPAAHPTR